MQKPAINTTAWDTDTALRITKDQLIELEQRTGNVDSMVNGIMAFLVGRLAELHLTSQQQQEVQAILALRLDCMYRQ